jgi:chromosome segregation ATPase
MNDRTPHGPFVHDERSSRSAIDTASEELDARDGAAWPAEGPLMQLAQRAVAERDALREELGALREALVREDLAGRRGGSAREVATLREALDLREREVRRLKDANVAREQLLSASRARLDEAQHERAAALAKYEARDRQAAEAEGQRDAAVLEARGLRRRLDALEGEHSRASSSERALSAALEDARLRLAERDRDVEALRAELSDTREALAGSERAGEDREARWFAERADFEEARAALKAQEEHRARLEEGLAKAQAEFTMFRIRAETEIAEFDTRRAHAEAERIGLVRGGSFRERELLAELSVERAARLCEASRQGQSLDRLRAQQNGEIAALRAALTEADAAWAVLEGERRALAARLEEVEVERRGLSARVEAVEGERRELAALYEACDQTRERLALSAVEHARRAAEARRSADEATEALASRTREMAELAGTLTRATVEQFAWTAAMRAGRERPRASDIDAALLAVGDRVPPSVHDQLWAVREEIIAAIATTDRGVAER